MKFLALVLPFVGLASAIPLSGLYDNGDMSVLPWYKQKYPGFNIDLSAQRLVQMEGMEPVLMTEMEKVMVKVYSAVLFILIALFR
jgi:leucyl aminopeptidase